MRAIPSTTRSAGRSGRWRCSCRRTSRPTARRSRASWVRETIRRTTGGSGWIRSCSTPRHSTVSGSERSATRFGHRQPDVEAAALARRRLYPNPSAVRLDDALHDREADPAPIRGGRLVVLALGRNAGEDVEDRLLEGRRDADAVVAHRDERHRPLALATHLDPPDAGQDVLDGVAQQVAERVIELALLSP